MESVRTSPSSEKYKNGNQFIAAAKDWAIKFRKNTFDEDVTPLMHSKSKSKVCIKCMLKVILFIF